MPAPTKITANFQQASHRTTASESFSANSSQTRIPKGIQPLIVGTSEEMMLAEALKKMCRASVRRKSSASPKIKFTK